MKTAEQIVEALAQWSEKYPRSKIYPASNKEMDEELVAIESMAKELINQSQPEAEAGYKAKSNRGFSEEDIFGLLAFIDKEVREDIKGTRRFTTGEIATNTRILEEFLKSKNVENNR